MLQVFFQLLKWKITTKENMVDKAILEREVGKVQDKSR
jgi:hypothetical protein